MVRVAPGAVQDACRRQAKGLMSDRSSLSIVPGNTLWLSSGSRAAESFIGRERNRGAVDRASGNDRDGCWLRHPMLHVANIRMRD